ncbi:Hemoglobin-like flavoprotein [Cognatiyoonia koreensis]|uniref:Hemoglobin-like flavoprotein n=1 Tax=Cognatiyoonia koreensis TaxID=364200 RepID=A0A1I0MYA2_9RHOB|nr:globin domain-containing protein [Cognatiyoonia koreensis]SEV93878.1 Hemoglobin-like flavoprotein [Cognatiyoonia koreensis]
MLSQTQVDLIRTSAEVLAEANVAATNVFYANLFRVAPGVRNLFSEDMFEQSEKLWNTIVKVVESARDLTEIEADLHALGARHVHYGAEPGHYVVVTDVLIQTISSMMEDKWTDETQAAWKTALEAVCATMLEGAAQRVA